MYPVVFFTIAITYAAVRNALMLGSPANKLANFIKAIIFMNVGCAGIMAFIAHIFFADATAEQIGWAPGSPFQSEMGFTNLALGVVGLISPFSKPYFWLATVIFNTIILLGAAWVHYQQWLLGNEAPYNSGVFLWGGDVCIPLILAILMGIYYFRFLNSFEGA